MLITQEKPVPAMEVARPRDDGRTAEVVMSGGGGRVLVTLDRPDSLRIGRELEGELAFWCQGRPELRDDLLLWRGSGELRVVEGTISRWDPEGHSEELKVGNGRLSLRDPAPRSFPSGVLRPTGRAVLVLEVRTFR